MPSNVRRQCLGVRLWNYVPLLSIEP